MRKKGGKGSSPTTHSQFRLLHPLLTSQTIAITPYIAITIAPSIAIVAIALLLHLSSLLPLYQ
jgi:hypothetical protein